MAKLSMNMWFPLANNKEIVMYEKILIKYEPKKENLLRILHEIQDSNPNNYISQKAIEEIGKYLNVPYNHIYGVVTFYTMFHTKPRGKNIIRICDSPTCFLKGSKTMIQKLKELLQIEVGETTKDELFTLETTSCLGVCANAPVMMINKTVYGDLNEEKLEKIINDIKGRQS